MGGCLGGRWVGVWGVGGWVFGGQMGGCLGGRWVGVWGVGGWVFGG